MFIVGTYDVRAYGFGVDILGTYDVRAYGKEAVKSAPNPVPLATVPVCQCPQSSGSDNIYSCSQPVTSR